MNKLLLMLFCVVALPFIVVAGILAMPLHGIFWALGVNDQFMAVCDAAGEQLRDRIKIAWSDGGAAKGENK